MSEAFKPMSKEEAAQYLNDILKDEHPFCVDDAVEELVGGKFTDAAKNRDAVLKKIEDMQANIQRGQALLLNLEGELESLGSILVECEEKRRLAILSETKTIPTEEEWDAMKDKE